jgi:hypothetical protein
VESRLSNQAAMLGCWYWFSYSVGVSMFTAAFDEVFEATASG